MKKPMILLTVMAVATVGGALYVASQPADGGAALPAPQAASAAPATSLPAPVSVNASALPAVAQSASASAPAVGVRSSSASASADMADQASALRTQINALGLTRELTSVQTVSYDDRSRSVLGTKETTNADGTQTVLVIRDNTSGQIDYWQSALQFVLKPGNDYESFIKQRPAMQRRFVNIEQAQVTVDAANIAAEHAALKADARVASVNFMPVTVRPTAR